MPVSKQTTHGSVVLTIRRAAITATIIMLVGGGSSLAEEGIGGWVVEWNATTTGGYSESDGCVGTLPNGECRTLSNSMEIEGQSSGRYIITDGGLILNGSAQASYATVRRQHGNGVCFPNTTVGDFYSLVSQHTHTGSGPEKGAYGSVLEAVDDDGSPIVTFNFNNNGSCSGVFTETNMFVDSTTCQPYEDTVTTPYAEEGTCYGWAQLPGSAGFGLPDDESRLSYSGTEITNLEIPVDWLTVTGIPYTTTMTMTAEKIPVPVIHGIELTQAIQIYQTLDDMARTIGSTGSPPIPIVAYKPLAIRVVLDKPVVTVKAIIEVFWNGTNVGTESLTQTPACAPPDTTAFSSARSSLWNQPDCKTADFIVGGRPDGESQPLVNDGDNRLVVKLYSDDPHIGNELLDEFEFVIDAKATDTVMLGAVNVCATRIGGRWQCLATPVRDLLDGTVLMRKIYPTDDVQVIPTGHQVRLEVVENASMPSPDYNPDGTADEWDCYDSQGRKVINGSVNTQLKQVDIIDFMSGTAVKCEKDIWWYVALSRINRLYTTVDTWLDAAGIRKFYYGLVKPNDLLEWGGMAWAVGEGRAAIGFAPGTTGSYEITRMWVRDTVPHEIGHLLDLSDIQSDKDSAAKIAQQCAAWDATATVAPPWLYLFSGEGFVIKPEVPFDVATSKAIPPFIRHDVMGYCSGRVWASPFTYKHLFEELNSSENDGVAAQKSMVAASDTVESPTQAVGVAGEYWLVSGFVDEDSVYLDTIIAFETVGPSGVGAGSHQLDVLDQAGVVLFTRKFTPATAVPKSTIPDGGLPDLPLSFVQLIPVQSSAAKIEIRDSAGLVLAEEQLGGLEPKITMVFPIGGEQVSGEQTLMWTASDDDSDISNLVYWVQYSADAGSTWITLGQDFQDNSLVVDFDDLPGSSGTAVVRVLASDRANTGSVTSDAFTVGKKLPTVDILSPEIGDVTEVGGLVFFEGYGYDLDDGALPRNTHSWSSDRDGDIAVGYKVSTSALSEGQHNVRLSVTDSDSNVAFADVTVFIGDFVDEDRDGVADGQDQCPGTPAGEAVDGNGCSASQLDSDGDGVNDAADLCANTPAGETANASGCSASQLDSDGDGVSDALDQCAGTPAGEAVNADGCSASQRDSDSDGVSDALDQCAGTPAGTAVGSNGCAVSQPTSGSSGSGGGSFGLFAIFVLGVVAARRRASMVKVSDLDVRLWPRLCENASKIYRCGTALHDAVNIARYVVQSNHNHALSTCFMVTSSHCNLRFDVFTQPRPFGDGRQEAGGGAASRRIAASRTI